LRNLRLIRANPDSPYYPGLTDVLLKAFGPPAVIGTALARVPGIVDAVIFGSWAARYHEQHAPRPVGDIDRPPHPRRPRPRPTLRSHRPSHSPTRPRSPGHDPQARLAPPPAPEPSTAPSPAGHSSPSPSSTPPLNRDRAAPSEAVAAWRAGPS